MYSWILLVSVLKVVFFQVWWRCKFVLITTAAVLKVVKDHASILGTPIVRVVRRVADKAANYMCPVPGCIRLVTIGVNICDLLLALKVACILGRRKVSSMLCEVRNTVTNKQVGRAHSCR